MNYWKKEESLIRNKSNGEEQLRIKKMIVESIKRSFNKVASK